MENIEFKKRIAELESARMAYACEFQLNEDGEPDVDNVHANIRKLKTDNAKLQEALSQMCIMWKSVCSVHGWDPAHLVEYKIARDTLSNLESLPNE